MRKKSSSSVRVFYPPFNREDLLAMLRQRVPMLQEKLPLKRVVLFGSYAEGRQTIASDIDLLIIYAGQPREDAYVLAKRTLNIHRLEPHVYAEAEVAQVGTTIERMVRDGIPIHTTRLTDR
jgi:predicted nucleotidyltransferase